MFRPLFPCAFSRRVSRHFTEVYGLQKRLLIKAGNQEDTFLSISLAMCRVMGYHYVMDVIFCIDVFNDINLFVFSVATDTD